MDVGNQNRTLARATTTPIENIVFESPQPGRYIFEVWCHNRRISVKREVHSAGDTGDNTSQVVGDISEVDVGNAVKVRLRKKGACWQDKELCNLRTGDKKPAFVVQWSPHDGARAHDEPCLGVLRNIARQAKGMFERALSNFVDAVNSMLAADWERHAPGFPGPPPMLGPQCKVFPGGVQNDLLHGIFRDCESPESVPASPKPGGDRGEQATLPTEFTKEAFEQAVACFLNAAVAAAAEDAVDQLQDQLQDLLAGHWPNEHRRLLALSEPSQAEAQRPTPQAAANEADPCLGADGAMGDGNVHVPDLVVGATSDDKSASVYNRSEARLDRVDSYSQASIEDHFEKLGETRPAYTGGEDSVGADRTLNTSMEDHFAQVARDRAGHSDPVFDHRDSDNEPVFSSDSLRRSTAADDHFNDIGRDRRRRSRRRGRGQRRAQQRGQQSSGPDHARNTAASGGGGSKARAFDGHVHQHPPARAERPSHQSGTKNARFDSHKHVKSRVPPARAERPSHQSGTKNARFDNNKHVKSHGRASASNKQLGIPNRREPRQVQHQPHNAVMVPCTHEQHCQEAAATWARYRKQDGAHARGPEKTKTSHHSRTDSRPRWK